MFMPSIFGEDLFDQVFNDFGAPARGPKHPGKFHPANTMRTDVKESTEGYDIDIELPGYKKDDIKAELKDGFLTVSATKIETKEDTENKNYIRKERYCGSCSRSFFVGEDVTQDDIKAKFEDGILKLMVPKIEKKPAIEEKKLIAIEG